MDEQAYIWNYRVASLLEFYKKRKCNGNMYCIVYIHYRLFGLFGAVMHSKLYLSVSWITMRSFYLSPKYYYRFISLVDYTLFLTLCESGQFSCILFSREREGPMGCLLHPKWSYNVFLLVGLTTLGTLVNFNRFDY